MNGSSLELGVLLGEMRTEGRRQTEILLSMLKEQRDLPGRLASQLSRHTSAPAAERHPPPPPQATIRDWIDLLKAAWPLALIAAVALGKVTAPDVLPLIRHGLGLGP